MPAVACCCLVGELIPFIVRHGMVPVHVESNANWEQGMHMVNCEQAERMMRNATLGGS